MLRDDYFKWLAKKVGATRKDQLDVLKILYETEFVYSIPNDINRVGDGLKLRETYLLEVGENGLKRVPANMFKKAYPCSVLEVLIALSDRVAEDLIGDYSEDQNKVSAWFWLMMTNLSISKGSGIVISKDKVNYILDRWMKREFDSNGTYSPFPIKKPINDQRKIEIWQQLLMYLVEHPELES